MLDRFKAFAVHFALSVVVALLVVALVFLAWYPAPLADATGVTRIFVLLLLVDVMLGPVLTFAVYKRGKKSLKLDLTVIVFIQLAALGYGLFTLAEGRPAWLVYSADRFDLVRVIDQDTRDSEKVKPQYQNSIFSPPRWVAALPSDDAQENSTITLEAVYAGLDYAQRPYLYRPLADAADAIRKHAQPLENLDQFNPPDVVKKQLRQWPKANAWLPLMAKAQPMAVLINRESAEVVAIVNLLPWQDESP